MSGAEKKENIVVYNASENNLKGITVQFPLDQFTCVTGPSGCGKSSLVFDTVYAESQRNFLESMSGNMFGQKLMDKPKVDRIENLRPALNISQKYYNVNPRSTVGTITDISYYLRTLFAFVINQQTGSHWDMNHFSANNPASCCPRCNGLGEEYVISEQAVIPDKTKTLASGGILYYKGAKDSQEYRLLQAICEYYGIDINTRVCDLTEEERNILLYRTTPQTFTVKFKTPKGRTKTWPLTERGAMVELETKLKGISKQSTFDSIVKYLKKEPCSLCHGKKLNQELLENRICGYSIGEAEQLPASDLKDWCSKVRKEYKKSAYFTQIDTLLSDVERRAQHLIDLNLEYISVGRSIPTLSGGELQRVRLATQLDCSLSGMIYILDEPCKGLHYKNVNSIVQTTHDLVKKGNTVIAIEHNGQYISSADHIIEMGPEGGPAGGLVTDEYAGGLERGYSLSFKTPRKAKKFLELKGIKYRNLKNIDVRIPIGSVTCISGVSGSGKSSLTDIIEEVCDRGESSCCSAAEGTKHVKKIMRVNQQPIGKTARSTVISYLDIYNSIRDIFAGTDAAKQLGFSASDFSMNVAGGRCECCQGTGKKKIELSYLPESFVICPECNGKRFRDDLLSVKYKGYSINDILNENIHTLLSVFEDQKTIYSVLKCMDEIGMGYVSLGQMSMNLSGGEAQRIKLAKYLGLSSKGNSLYILDEPTSGLNERDINRLIDVINRLADNGETIVIIEHNIEFIARIADYLIDLGSIAGNAGGKTVIEGDPKSVMCSDGSSWKELVADIAE